MSKQRILGDLAHNLDSAAVGSFLAKSSAGGDFQTVDYSSITGTPSVVLDSSLTSQLIDSSYIQLRETPSISGIDSATALNLIDSSYLNNINGTNTGFAEFYYNATAGQTIFDSDLRGRNLSYTEGGVMVFLNGVMLAPSQYTATDGTTVVLDSGASLSDEITVVKFGLGSSGGGGSSSITWGGDRGMVFGGKPGGTPNNDIYYIDITTPGNASSFGNLTSNSEDGSAAGDGTYGVHSIGSTGTSPYWSNIIDYVTISTTGNATDFGDMTSAKAYTAACGDGTKGYWGGGTGSGSNVIEYVTIASPGNAQDFGDLNVTTYDRAGLHDGTYGIWAGGYINAPAADEIDYIATASSTTASDFGNLSVARIKPMGACDGTYGVFGAGRSSTTQYHNTIDYITTATPGNATDFGDMTEGVSNCNQGMGNNTYGVFPGGRHIGEFGIAAYRTQIDYVTITTPGNSTDFGDLTLAVAFGAGCCSGNAS